MAVRMFVLTAVVLAAAVVSGETVNIAVETVRQGGARAVWETAILRLQSAAFGGSASEGGFDWCIGEVDSALTVVFADPFNDLPSGKKWHPMIDRYVPFWQLVYHGIVLSTPFRTMWNIEAKPDKWRYRLCAAEYGNYADAPQTADGVTVPARDYVVVR